VQSVEQREMAAKLKKAELREFKDRLLMLRARLQGDVVQLTDEALRKNQQGGSNLSNMPLHLADLGTDNFEQEQSLRLLESEEDTLEKIDKALARLEAGKFGMCDECGGPIPKLRLKAIPFAPYCVECTRKYEERR
jgi:DnaK suppressor protein